VAGLFPRSDVVLVLLDHRAAFPVNGRSIWVG
jgi:hypothetical protein